MPAFHPEAVPDTFSLKSLPDQTIEFDGENQKGWKLCPWLHPLKTTPVSFGFLQNKVESKTRDCGSTK